MKITCFGSTGSIPAPSSASFQRTKFGGNTTSFLVESGKNDFVIDMGSGAKGVGKYLAQKYGMFAPTYEGKNINVLLTHYHWDHIQGIPFFVPLYVHKNIISFFGFEPRQDPSAMPRFDNKVLDMLEYQQSTPGFPVPFREMPASKEYFSHSPMFSETIVETDTLKIVTVPLNHPDGCTGYVFIEGDKKVAFLFDNEPYPYPNANIKKLCNKANLAFMDVQYTEAQIGGMCQGFGHGTAALALRDADAAGIETVAGCHLDPDCDDAKLDTLETSMLSFVREGQSWEV